MDWIDRMNSALDYIENNLEDDINYKKIAQVAHSSEYHFPRMFSSISGISLSEYIRRRRLTLAAFDIQKSDIRIIDVIWLWVCWLETLSINHSTWAVFPGIENTWNRLYTEWVPTSGYELADIPCIECFYPPKHKPRNELWVAVIPK